jgi:hypothetical protein
MNTALRALRTLLVAAPIALFAACGPREATPGAPVSADAVAGTPLPAISLAVANGRAPASPFFTDAMDAPFRETFAGPLLAQVETGDWAAFLPADGSLFEQGARVSLRDGSVGPGKATRACTAAELEGTHSNLLRQLVASLTDRSRRSAEDGFSCEAGNAPVRCRAHFGEMGFNGELVFARTGDAVQLVAVRDHEVGVTEDVQRALDRADRARKAARNCPKKF